MKTTRGRSLAFRAFAILAIASAAACADAGDESVVTDGDARDDSFLGDGKADVFGVTEGSADACAVLRFVNEADMAELAHIHGNASYHLTAYRSGEDMILFTSDDVVIDTLAELDAIPYIGPSTFNKLRIYAVAHYPCAAEPQKADDCTVLRVANEATLEELDVQARLDRRAAVAIVEARPIATLEELDAVRYVGTSVIDALASYGAAEGFECAVECTARGGTYDGVDFTRDEECAVVDFMNDARLSQMKSLGTNLRAWVYDCAQVSGRVDCTQGRLRTWTELSPLDPLIGKTSMQQLKGAASQWQADGVTTDTVADVWRMRSDLAGAPVGFDDVVVTRKLPSGSTARFCYEIRDSETAPNYLRACVTPVWSDENPPCNSEECLDVWVGRHAAFRGTLKSDSRGPYVALPATRSPTAPLP